MNNKTREEHVKWCKQRALEYVNENDLMQALTSIASDLTKHPETKEHAGIQIGMQMIMGGKLNTKESMRKFIEGFN